jgi:hypothetical protein
MCHEWNQDREVLAIMMIDMDNHGEWKLVTKEQIDKTMKSERK